MTDDHIAADSSLNAEEIVRSSIIADAGPNTPINGIVTDETGWVIERADSPTSEPKYWCAGMLDANTFSAWTSNHMQAIRFARRIDAERLCERLMNPKNISVRICEHQWRGGGNDR